MKKIVKNSIECTIITISLCILVVVLAAAIRGIATNSTHHSFFQMVSDNLPEANSLIKKGTPSQSIVDGALGILTIFLFFAGIVSNHILFKKHGWLLEKLSWLTLLVGIILSVLLMSVFIFMSFSNNILIKLLFSFLIGGNLYLLFRLILDYSYTFLKFSSEKRNQFPVGITASNKKGR